MALKIVKVEVDPNDKYRTRQEFHEDYADVLTETPDADANALLVACSLDEGTATMVATHGVWPDAADDEAEKLPVFTVEFSGVNLENMSDLAELASFAVLDRVHGYDPAAWRSEFIELFEAAMRADD